MRTLFFSDHFFPEPSAPAAHVYERARLWVSQGHHVTVLCSAPNFLEGKLFPGYRNALRTVEMLDGIRVVRVLSEFAPRGCCADEHVPIEHARHRHAGATIGPT